MEKTFLNREKAIITAMVQANNPCRIKELMDKSLAMGSEAFGVQFEQMKPEYRKKEVYNELFTYTDKPIYVTNYRHKQNEGKNDEVLSEEILELAECGATLCDIMGDYFDEQPGELTTDKQAVEKQMLLIDKLHEKGAEVLMSSHISKFTPADEVLKIALEHQKRGADIAKIVTGAETMEQQVENLRILTLLKKELDIPFLFLTVGECRIIRRIGGELGSCMYLGVCEHDEYSTPEQPLIKNLKSIRENM